jgi:hypothetical protein
MLKSRIDKIEKKLNGKNGVIPSWAIKIVEDKAKFAQYWHETRKTIVAAMRLIGRDRLNPVPPKVWTREEILAYAAELGKKYQSVMEYCADIKPMNFADIKNKRRF